MALYVKTLKCFSFDPVIPDEAVFLQMSLRSLAFAARVPAEGVNVSISFQQIEPEPLGGGPGNLHF